MLFEFDFPDRCVVGTLGQPGNRLFLVQIAQGGRLAAVALEKQQVRVLAQRVNEVLDQLTELGHVIPPAGPPVDLGPLDAPVEVTFRAAAVGMAWDGQAQCLHLELFSIESDENGEHTIIHIKLNPLMAREFVARTEMIVASGRPACPACAQPLDPGGHICPRANGYRGDLFA